MAAGCFFSEDFFDPAFFDVCVAVVADAGPPWRMRPLEQALFFPEKALVGQVAGLRRRQEERAEIELTAQIVAATIANRRQEVAGEIARQRADSLARLARKEKALNNLAKAQVKQQLGSLDPQELVRLKNLQAKRLAALKKARQALKRKRGKS